MTRSLITGERYRRDCPPETDDKKTARLFLYKHALGALRVGHAVTLAGTEPFAEVELIRDYLRWPATRSWFVDWAKNTDTRSEVLDALRGIKHRWPEANVVHGNIIEVIEDLPSVGFANLDFMGFMDRRSMQPAVRAVISKLVRGGVMGLTWFRGRDIDEPWRSASDVHAAARDVADLNDRRWVGVLRMVDGWAKEAGVHLELVGAMEYQHHHSPMSVAVWRRT